jgi:ATP-dependent phosphofructokinase / diphosphate-dependent phosphofructokinase
LRVGIVFSGGPAPAANAVISSAAVSFLEAGHDVVGFLHGYSHLVCEDPLVLDEHYRVLGPRDVSGIRNARGIVLGTARANPGKGIRGPADLADPVRAAGLVQVHRHLDALGVDALISIGGDDTLKTANFLVRVQDFLPVGRRVRVVHLPKTIDNDYKGIDFTFGFFTAVDVMAKALLNLRADAEATSSWFLVETMGRKAGWLAYGVALAGEANLVISVEDVDESLTIDGHLCLDKLSERVVDVMLAKESRGSHFGTVVLAEGLAELLDPSFLATVTRDEHGHISLSKVDLSKLAAVAVSRRYKERTGQKKKVRGVQLGYESRCASPHAFDVILGSQLGIGAYRALMEEGLDAHMVSVTGQLDLVYVPFHKLVDPETLVTEVRLVEPGSDFHRLARFLETRTDPIRPWHLGRRPEK